ncbi:MAG TPA: baseplate J/gp47 family protein [Longimicrobium sp.]|jgi:uncharacterized phage protein gp47/JayE
MAETTRTGGQGALDYLARDYDSLLRSMREMIPRKLPEWTEYESEADFGNVLLQLFAHMGDILSYYQDRVAGEAFLGTARTRRSVIQHLRLIGYRLATAAPASASLDIAFPATCEETVVLRRGDAFATKSTRERPSVRFEYTPEQPLLIDCRALAVDDATGKKLYRGVPVEEGRLVEREFLGTSDGTPDQRFPLASPRLILRSLGPGQAIHRDLVVLTELGGVITEWTVRESLAFSRADQPDVAVEVDEDDRAVVQFGDGALGKIPEAGASVTATYRVGGGAHGNVPAGSIGTVVDAPQLSLLAADVTNPAPATGGAERESIEHAVRHAPSVFRSLRRAVTAADYRALALQLGGVGKVRSEATNWNTVTLYVAPQGGGHVSDVLQASLLAYFEDKRPITTTIEVEDVDYVAVYVTAEVGVKGYYSAGRVKEQVERAGAALLAFENVDFGQTVYLSKFYEAIENIDGVAYVNITEFRRGDGAAAFEATGKLVMGPNEIPTAPGDDPAYAAGIRVVLPEELAG